MGNEVWNDYLLNHNFPSSMYGKEYLTDIAGESYHTVIQRLNEILNALATDYLNYLSSKHSIGKLNSNDFKVLQATDKWKLLLNKYKLPYSEYKNAYEIVKILEKTNNQSSTIKAISNLDDMLETYYQKLVNKTPKIDLINDFTLLDFILSTKDYDLISESQLKEFWKSFVIHHDLTLLKYEYNNVKSTLNYNTQATINLMDIFFRYVAYSRMNYLVIYKKNKLLDVNFFIQKTSKEIWNTLRNDYGLHESEYEKAKYIENVISKGKLDVIPKTFVKEAFKNLCDLLKILYIQASNYSLKQKQKNEIRDDLSIINQLNQKIIEDEDNYVENNGQSEFSINREEDIMVIEQPGKLQDELKSSSSKNFKHMEVNKTNSGVIQSRFLQKIKILQTSSKESVVHSETFGQFQQYMHVERNIEKEVLNILKDIQKSDEPQLLLLCGSVGDGKSHLLAYIKHNYPELLENCIVHNDATESNDPNQSSLETLEKLLQTFNDNKNSNDNKHIIVAINLGVLHNFYTRQVAKSEFRELCHFINESNVFGNELNNISTQNKRFKLINFSQERNFAISENGVSSDFFFEIIKKITANVDENEFYIAWKEDVDANKVTIAHENFALLMNEQIQKRVVEKLVQIILRNKVIISTRAFYNFIFDILVPTEQLLNMNKTGFNIKNSLPNLIFNHPDRSNILSSFSEIDPIIEKGQKKDEFVTNLLMSSNILVFLKNYFSMFEKLPFEKIIQKSIQNEELIELSQFALRLSELVFVEEDTDYKKFTRYLYYFYKGEGEELDELFEILDKTIYKWKGSPKDGYVYISNNINKDFRIAAPLQLDPIVDEKIFGSGSQSYTITKFNDFIRIGYGDFLFDLDFRLFELLNRVNEGYRPNNIEINNAVQFEEFYNQLIKSAEEKEKEILLIHPNTGEKFVVSKPKFSKSKYEVKKV